MKLSEKDAVITALLRDISAKGVGTAENVKTESNKMEVTIRAHTSNALEDIGWKASAVGAEVDAIIKVTIEGDEPEPTDYETRFKNLVAAIRKEYEESDEILSPNYKRAPDDEERVRNKYLMEWATLRQLLRKAGEEV